MPKKFVFVCDVVVLSEYFCALLLPGASQHIKAVTNMEQGPNGKKCCGHELNKEKVFLIKQTNKQKEKKNTFKDSQYCTTVQVGSLASLSSFNDLLIGNLFGTTDNDL